MVWLSAKVWGMRLWQWLILLALLLANICVGVTFLPRALSEIGPGTDIALSPQPDGAVALAAGSPAQSPTEVPAAQVTTHTSAQAPEALPTLTPVPQPTLVLMPTSSPLPASTPSSAPDPALPDEAHLSGLSGQRQSLPLSCEARAAANWAAYFGVAIDEMEFLQRLPASDNPDFGFVGDVHGRWGQIPPDPYGVHAGPVAVLLRQYGLNAYARHGLTWDDLRAQIAAGRPVIVWVVGHVERGVPVAYTTPNGLRTVVARYEHTVILTGYTPDRVTILDGKKVYTRSLENFLESWAVLGNMAIIRGLLPTK